MIDFKALRSLTSYKEIDWDEWRASYDARTFKQEAEFYNTIAPLLPPQVAWGPAHAGGIVQRALDGVETVTEIGPWQADLAAAKLPGSDITRWTAYDLCTWAIENTHCTDERFAAVLLTGHPWDTDLKPADLLIASHVLEHIMFSEFVELAEQFPKFGRLYLDIPVPAAERPDWAGYEGTHIIDASWADLDKVICSHGFVMSAAHGSARVYESAQR